MKIGRRGNKLSGMGFAGKSIFFVSVALLLFVPFLEVFPPALSKKVLIYFSYEGIIPTDSSIEKPLRWALRSGSSDPFKFYTEYMGVSRFTSESI